MDLEEGSHAKPCNQEVTAVRPRPPDLLDPLQRPRRGSPSDVWAWPGQSQSTIYGHERNRPIGIQGRWRRKTDRANEQRVPGRGGAARSFKSSAVGEERVLVFGSRVSGREVSAGTLRAWGGGLTRAWEGVLTASS